MTWLTAVILPLLFGAIGAAFTIFMSVSGWFGRMLADRLLTEHRARFDAELKRLQGQIDRTIIVHRAHFETEFAAMQEIWKKVAELRAVFYFITQLNAGDADPETPRYMSISRALDELVNAIDQRSPFYWRELYADLDALRTFARTSLSLAVLNDTTGLQRRQFWNEFQTRVIAISDKIRARIESLTVVA